MIISSVGFLLIFGIRLVFCNSKNRESIKKDELVFAHVIFRHGNRNLLDNSTYATDPFKYESFWPEGFGQLTNAGKRTEYKLGKYLRKRYEKFIGSDYSAKKVYVRSTDKDRALMSAECAMAALFPPSIGQIWRSDFRWQPVPIHTIPLDEDYLLLVPECPRTENLTEQYLMSYDIKVILEANNGLLQFLETNSKTRVRTVSDVAVFYEALVREYEVGLPLSDWAKYALKLKQSINGELIGTLAYFAAIKTMVETHTTELKKIRSGFLLKEMLNRFKDMIISPNERLLWIYSAHDITIVNFLNSLNVYELHIPPYGASIHFELYRRGQMYYVQLFYRKRGLKDVPPINIPNCGTMCPLNKFQDLYRDILPTESETYKSLCKI